MPKTTPTPRVPPFPPADCTEPSHSIVNASESKEVIPLAEKEGYVTHTEAGLVIKEGMPFETWLAGAPTYEMMFRKAPWWWGDYLIYGAKHYGEMHAQAVSGYTEGHVDNVVSVCERFPVERRQATLFFSHHKAAASLPPQEADRLLLQASREHWTLKDVASKVSLYHEVNGTKPKRGRKKKGANVHFKVNANAVSEPLTIDGHIEVQEKPLIWNGYPLRVMALVTGGRVILQGEEPLTSEEADHAAHFHKFNHKEGLMNWLEEHNFIKPEGGEIPCSPKQSEPESPKTSESASAHLSAQLDPINSGVPSTGASNGAAPNATESAPTPLEYTFTTEFPMAGRGETHTESEWLRIYGYEIATNPGKFTPKPTVAAPAAPPASPEPPKATETPLQACERHIQAFNEASKAVDWAEVGRNALRRVKWLGAEGSPGLLNRPDEIIDILQKNPPTPRK